ncbi:hypothetical protein [Brevundimonas sp. NIBR11]|uniref:hypothetical protein n=1 Tax=Brevundimonas sp. NIBR11 TaxID=3015999 RepID=UPI0022F0BA2A|nr:hypothetical protein [Brevundimonas sp. NIBR11]WGM31723.1 hypothetical protein KKHFBJBL_01971 [Brevundimonas sp. NIBR11]
MQNRNDRNRGYDDNQSSGWRDDDVTWETRDRNRDEGRSWSSGGAERDFRRTEGYGQSSREGRGDYGRSPTSYDQYGASSHDASRGYGGRSDWNRDGGYSRSPRSGEFGQDYGYSRAYGQGSSQNYDRGRGAYGAGSGRGDRGGYGSNNPDHGYAPGAQIWEGRGGGAPTGRSDYEPDYLHWRDQQMSKFDRDYDEWRSEKRQKFSSDFDTWRSSRNAIVENVSDGGTGSQKDVKNS